MCKEVREEEENPESLVELLPCSLLASTLSLGARLWKSQQRLAQCGIPAPNHTSPLEILIDHSSSLPPVPTQKIQGTKTLQREGISSVPPEKFVFKDEVPQYLLADRGKQFMDLKDLEWRYYKGIVKWKHYTADSFINIKYNSEKRFVESQEMPGVISPPLVHRSLIIHSQVDYPKKNHSVPSSCSWYEDVVCLFTPPLGAEILNQALKLCLCSQQHAKKERNQIVHQINLHQGLDPGALGVSKDTEAGERRGAPGRPASSAERPPEPRLEIVSLASEMMGVGNGRRSMKSPPLLLAALVACVIVLGFNYWIASSRSVDLQTRIMELEGRVRRAAAERGAVELKKNEFQGELEKQREQLDRIQSSHDSQMESVNKLYQDEKAALVHNITTGERLIRTLQDQFKALQKNYGKLQRDVLQFQKNQTNLERKFSYDLSQCINQMKELKEQCEEQIEEVTKKGNEAVASRDLSEKDQSQQLRALGEPQPRLQEIGQPQADVPPAKGGVPSNSEPQTPAPSSQAALDLKRRGEKEETNEIQVISEEELRRDRLGLPREPGQRQAGEDDSLVGRRGMGEAQGGQTPQVPAALLAIQENQELEELEREQLVIPDGQEEGQGADEEGRNQQKLGEDGDYNMDENEAESETDKQVALTADDRTLPVLNAENQKIDTINLLDQNEKRNHTL
ncbi:Golgi membrane protein 1 [Manis javanica]|nr:Golgi membrane protein 1 [Manis javanica]